VHRLRFDFPPSLQGGPAVYTDPVRVIHADTLDEVVPALRAVEEATEDGLHAAGCIAYEAAPALDPAMAARGGGAMPLVLFGLFKGPEVYDAEADSVEDPARTDERTAADPTPGPSGTADPAGADLQPLDWTLEMTREEHAAAVVAIREAIAEGRTYQVNLTARLRANGFRGDPEVLYHGLRRAQGRGYHALLDLGRYVVLSASPELFFRTRGREITTRPMKGTRPRGRWPEEDDRLRRSLLDSMKDRAENLMIVDLLRNDLGRICLPGAVSVPRLHQVERYRTVWQMTSTITGTLRPDAGIVDIFRALFPCGSVTGAPKISTMEVIARLEQSPREVYCGAIGWVRPGGDAAFSVPIRTAWLDRTESRLTYGAGGGVVWDSTPDEEHDELLAKTTVVRSPWPPFRLVETLALDGGRAVRLERHVQRMAASARRFDFPFPEVEIHLAIGDAASRHPAGRHRLRVTLGPAGHTEVQVSALEPVGAKGPADGTEPGPGPGSGGAGSRGADPDEAGGRRASAPLDVAVAASPVDRRDPFLYHKTTNRAVYDRHLAGAPEAFDVLLWNEAGEATEFCRGNLVAELDGRLVTPPVSAGLLPGCLRTELLEENAIGEATIALETLNRATRLWLINSARGWIPVRVR
jgi:para-aminobenzoate synthetase/4-amino-4-deoxychorismate lyase